MVNSKAVVKIGKSRIFKDDLIDRRLMGWVGGGNSKSLRRLLPDLLGEGRARSTRYLNQILTRKRELKFN